MAEMMTTDVRAIMDRSPFDVAAVADLRELLNRDPSRYRTLREAVANIKEREQKEKEIKPEAHLRLGVGEVLLGRYNSGLEHLKKAGDQGMACFFRGLALANQQRYDQAAAAFAQAAKQGYDAKSAELHRAGALRRAGQTDEAKKILAELQKLSGSSGEYHFQQGCLLAAAGELVEASAEFEKTLSLEKDHNGALFELAYINDLYGNDDLALEYYQRCTDRPPVPLAAWINLGILYEDEMRFRDAEQCYRHVLAHEPNHPRARLFFKDCQASKGMYYDEEAERGYTVLKQLHEIPVTDFELSVRSRNCLRKMNIRTLGDLTRTTELALAFQQEFRRDLARRNQGNDAGQGLAAGDVARRQRTRRPRPPGRAAPGSSPRAAGDPQQADRRPQPFGASPQVREQAQYPDRRRPAQAHRRRAAGMQELRRDLAQRGSRQAFLAQLETEERLTPAESRPKE